MTAVHYSTVTEVGVSSGGNEEDILFVSLFFLWGKKKARATFADTVRR